MKADDDLKYFPLLLLWHYNLISCKPVFIQPNLMQCFPFK